MNLDAFLTKIETIALDNGFKTVKNKLLFDGMIADTELSSLLIELKGAERKGEGVNVNYEQDLDFHFLINRTIFENPAIVLLGLINTLNNAILADNHLKGKIEDKLLSIGDIDYSNEIGELEKKSFFSATQNIKLITNGYGEGSC
jgi:hypothetical protein